MRIALIRREDVTYIDGVNRFVYTLAAGLERLGHEVFVVGHTAEDREVAAQVFGPNIARSWAGSRRPWEYIGVWRGVEIANEEFLMIKI